MGAGGIVKWSTTFLTSRGALRVWLGTAKTDDIVACGFMIRFHG